MAAPPPIKRVLLASNQGQSLIKISVGASCVSIVMGRYHFYTRPKTQAESVKKSPRKSLCGQARAGRFQELAWLRAYPRKNPRQIQTQIRYKAHFADRARGF